MPCDCCFSSTSGQVLGGLPDDIFDRQKIFLPGTLIPTIICCFRTNNTFFLCYRINAIRYLHSQRRWFKLWSALTVSLKCTAWRLIPRNCYELPFFVLLMTTLVRIGVLSQRRVPWEIQYILVDRYSGGELHIHLRHQNETYSPECCHFETSWCENWVLQVSCYHSIYMQWNHITNKDRSRAAAILSCGCTSPDSIRFPVALSV